MKQENIFNSLYSPSFSLFLPHPLHSALLFPAQVNATLFSYCHVDHNSDAVSTLEFDSSLPCNAITAPLLQNPNLDMFYNLKLKGINVDGEALEVLNASFEVDVVTARTHWKERDLCGAAGMSDVRGVTNATSGDSIIVDSDTTVIKLWSQVYEKLREAFVSRMKGLPKAKGVLLFNTCYDLSSRIVWRKKEEGRMKKENGRKKKEERRKKSEEERKG
ncbi:hypothetical protein Fmac_027002 [Flemingia macrophylla]|uniref:Uncharacterized protein n=1 Tax=Flemingia macrophylla TaxID=520843 RepID=A0ABD1LGZ4_9FABA